MSKLNIDQKSVGDLFQDTKADFLIPDYQRPYAWTAEQCLTLWNDIFEFAFPNENSSNFNRADEYFLGPIVTFKNRETGKQEVIDGQQRLTTLMLLLRAFYDKFQKAKDENTILTKDSIAKCIWKTDEYGKPMMDSLKIDSEVATDDAKEEFLSILKTGVVTKEQKSNYAQNFRFFQERINTFVQEYISYGALLPTRIMNNCILLPIEAESQDTALRIFSTLNDRGLPLSDSDIFKAQFYKYYTSIGKKSQFIEVWKDLEELTEKIFHPISGTPMDELFTRYMYYIRATRNIKDTTTESLRKFYEKDNYALMKQNGTLDDLVDLANFWNDILDQDSERFSQAILRRLFVLNYAPNGMWTYFLSVYYMTNKDKDGLLEETALLEFLNKITAFIWAYSVFKPGVNSLRTPVYAEMLKVVQGKKVDFAEFKFNYSNILSMFHNYGFYNGRPITKAMLAWWAFNDENQPLLSIDIKFDIEHIFARNRASHDSMADRRNLELLGNKALLEKRINIRASDYKFADKKKYYDGYTNIRGVEKPGTKNIELTKLAKAQDDFTETNIKDRNEAIINGFISFLDKNELIEHTIA